MAPNCRYEKVSRMSVCVLCKSDKYEVTKDDFNRQMPKLNGGRKIFENRPALLIKFQRKRKTYRDLIYIVLMKTTTVRPGI